MKQRTGFVGTYYELESVLRLEKVVHFAGWFVLAGYIFDTGYTMYQNIYGNIVNGYPFDFYSMISLLSRAGVGFMLFVILQVAAKIMLILVDIEDNTRRAARPNDK